METTVCSIFYTFLSQATLCIESLLPHEHPRVFFANPSQLVFALNELNKSLTLLLMEDQSCNTVFLHHLTATWRLLRQEGRPFRSRKSPPSYVEKTLLQFFHEVETFAQESLHGLSFHNYLMQYGNNNWTPMPFLHSLNLLRTEEISTLRRWIRYTKELAEDLLA